VNRVLIGLLAVVLAGVVAACGGPQASPEAQETADASPVAQATPEATPTPEETEEESPTEAALPSFALPDSAPELAALLPDEIAGAQAFKLSMSGEEMLAAPEGGEIDPEFVAFLERLGAEPQDVSFAVSAGTGGDGSSTVGVFAFRVEGADSDQLEREFQAVMEAQGEAVEWSPASVAGKDVLTAPDPDTEGNTMYVYTAGDIIFMVTAPDEATAAELLTDLP
jgi:hypothetical protein